MKKKTWRPFFWSFFILGLVVLVACSPAGGDEPDSASTEEPAREATAIEASASEEPPPTEEPAAEPTATELPPTEEPAGSEDERSEDAEAGDSDEQASETGDGLMTDDDRTERQKLVGADWKTEKFPK